MALSRDILTKVILGLSTAVGTSSVIAWKLSGSTNEAEVNVNGEKIKNNANDSDVKKWRENKNKLKTNKLGIPEECKSDQVTDKTTQECQLINDQIEKIKFDKENNKEISVGPLSWGKWLTLTIEYTDNTEHFPDNRKYIFTNKLDGENDKDVKIGNIKGGDVVLKKKGEGVEFRKIRSEDKLEKAPLEDKFGIPIDCKSYKVTEGKPSQTCQLTAEQLKKVKFEGVVNKEPIKVSGLGNNKVDLIISDASIDRMNYPEGKKYTFINKNNDPVIIDVSKDKSITLEKDKEITFREKDGNVLEKIIEINELGISKACEEKECDLSKEVLSKIKFDGFVDSTTTVEGLNYGEKIRLKFDGSSYIFTGADRKVTIKNGNQSVEFKVGYYSYFNNEGGKLKKQKEENKFNELGIPSNKCNTWDNNQECVLDFDDLKNINFSIKGSGELTITPSNSFGKKIPLRIEYAGEDKEYTDGIKYIFNFKDIKEDLTISGTETNNTIKFDGERDEEIWFKKNKDGKLEKTDTTPKVDSLGIPVWCEFEKDKNNPKECNLEIKYLEKIKFNMKESGDLKATVTEGNPTIKLIRKKVDPNKNEDKYGQIFQVNSTKYTFEVKDGNLKVSNVREEIHFKKGMDLEFTKENNKLKRAWDAMKLSNKVGWACYEKKECLTNQNTIEIFYDGTVVCGKEIQKKPVGSKKLRYYEDQEGYNQGIKLVPVEDIPLNSGGKLTKRDSFEIKYHAEKDNWYLTKVNPQADK